MTEIELNLNGAKITVVNPINPNTDKDRLKRLEQAVNTFYKQAMRERKITHEKIK